MYQYTTPTLIIFVNGIDFSHVDTFRVAIRGRKGELLKTISADSESVNADDCTIRIGLTQEESGSLGKGFSQVQVRVISDEDEVYATNKAKLEIDSVLDEVVV